MKLNLVILLLFSISVFSCKTVYKFSENQKINSFSNGKFHLEDNKSVKIPKYKSIDNTVIYLVRHAEKEKTRGDVHLTEEGKQRAIKLSEILNDEKINVVYSTRYNRTQETAEPTATLKNLNIQEYDPGKLEDFGKHVLEKHKGEKVLIVGHSNTTPNLLNIFMKETIVESMSESDYSNLYVISISKNENVKSLLLRY